MSDVEDYTTGRVLEKVLGKEKLLEKLEESDYEDVREELKRREEGAEEWLEGKDIELLKIRMIEANEKADDFWDSRGFRDHINIKFKELD